jgi:hypothetical protein
LAPPAPPTAPATGPADAPADEPVDEPVAETTPEAPQLTRDQRVAQANIARLKSRIFNYQKQIIQYQGTEYGAKIQKYLMQAQLDLQKNQAILDGTW